MKSIQMESHPLILAEFQAMREDGRAVLNPEQQETWAALCERLESRYLPRSPGPPPADLLFKNFDANQDGRLSEEEVFPVMWWRLQHVDHNRDHEITRQEYESSLGDRMKD
jgi:hypothetical protein